jgi:hypothetical protein
MTIDQEKIEGRINRDTEVCLTKIGLLDQLIIFKLYAQPMHDRNSIHNLQFVTSLSIS